MTKMHNGDIKEGAEVFLGEADAGVLGSVHPQPSQVEGGHFTRHFTALVIAYLLANEDGQCTTLKWVLRTRNNDDCNHLASSGQA
jgi:hypothetical protein